MWKLRVVILLLLLSFFFPYLSALDSEPLITLQRSEIISIRSELVALRESLKLKEIEIKTLLKDSAGQQEQIKNLLQDSKDLKKRINELLKDSEISEAEFQRTLERYKALLKDLTDSLNRVNRKLKNRPYWIAGAFIAGAALGAYGFSMVD